MSLFIPALAHAATLSTGVLAATSKKPTSSGSPIIFILLIVVIGAYFLFIAPQRRKMRAQVNQQNQFEVGDEVVTKSGIYGRVLSKDAERIRLEVAPGTAIDVMGQAIARRVDPVVLPDTDESDLDEHDEDDEHDGDVGVAWQTKTDDEEDGGHWTEPVHGGSANGTAASPHAGAQGGEPPAGGSV